MVEILFLAVAIFDLFGGAEGIVRLLAALCLILHPIHEQAMGFRNAFNLAVLGLDGPTGMNRVHYPERPLSIRRNALQATLLATVFPALALFGPWWALGGLVAFYLFDAIWTHGFQDIPALSSAMAGFLSATLAFLIASFGQPVIAQSMALVAAAMAIGTIILALPWIMAYRKVHHGQTQ